MRLLLILSLLLLSACANLPQQRVTNTNRSFEIKGTKNIYKKITQTFLTNNFQVKKVDKENGIISFEPREFQVKRGVLGVPWPVRATPQILIIDNSLSLQINYTCNYGAILESKKYWERCTTNDSEALKGIREEEKRIIDLIDRALR